MDRSSPHPLPSYYVYTRALLFPPTPIASHMPIISFPLPPQAYIISLPYHQPQKTTPPPPWTFHNSTAQSRRTCPRLSRRSRLVVPPFFPQHLGITDENGIPQMQDFMRLYSGLVERCFNACAQDFTSKALTTNEVCPFFFFFLIVVVEN